MNRYQEALCPLPGCGEILYITWKATRPIFLEDTAANLRDPADAYSAGWEIGCEEGHIVLLPIYAVGAAHDVEVFGDNDEEDTPDDLERLHALIATQIPKVQDNDG